MSFSKKYNKVAHQVNTEGFEYTNLKELHTQTGEDTVHQIDWMFIRSGKYGKHPIFINVASESLINIPAHLTETVEDILKDGEAVEAIKKGKVGFRVYTFKSHDKDCFGIEFIDN